MANYEIIDVFCDWKSELDKKRVKIKEESFGYKCNNCKLNICTLKINKISDEFIKKYKKSDLDYSMYEVELEKNNISFFKLQDD